MDIRSPFSSKKKKPLEAPKGARLVQMEVRAARPCPAKTIRKLAAIQVGEVKMQGNEAVWTLVESRTEKDEPYRYQRYRVMPGKISVEYAIMPDMHPQIREMEAVIDLLDLLAVLGDYPVDWPELYLLISRVLKNSVSVIDVKAEAAEAHCQSLRVTLEEKEGRYAEMARTNARLDGELGRIKAENESLRKRVQALEGMDDDALQDALMSWIRSHDGLLEYGEFAAANRMSAARLSMGVDRLLRQGYIRRI